MRTWHRWLGLLVFPFLLWTALTGLVIQYNHVVGQDERKSPTAEELARTHPGFTCPADLSCKPRGHAGWQMQVKHLHAGQPFGPLGTALSIVAGLALAFFSLSGLWLYTALWRARAARGLKPRWFWR